MAKTKKETIKEEIIEKAAPVEPVEQTGAAAIKQKKAAKIEEPKVEPIANDLTVDVASAVNGELIWVSKRTGYKVIWNEFGEKNPLTVADLLDMRNGDRAFFVNNWVTIEDPRADEIMKHLGIDKFYKLIKSVDDLDEIILGMDPDKIKTALPKFSYSLKETIILRAQELKNEGRLDSSRRIKALEDGTGMEIDV